MFFTGCICVPATLTLPIIRCAGAHANLSYIMNASVQGSLRVYVPGNIRCTLAHICYMVRAKFEELRIELKLVHRVHIRKKNNRIIKGVGRVLDFMTFNSCLSREENAR